MAAINLDRFDTTVPQGGIEIEIRGEVFRLRKSTVADSFDDTVKDRGWETEDELKEFIRARMFTNQKEFDKFWRVITSEYKHDDQEQSKSPMGYGEVIVLANRMMSIANGVVIGDEDENPKEASS